MGVGAAATCPMSTMCSSVANEVYVQNLYGGGAGGGQYRSLVNYTSFLFRFSVPEKIALGGRGNP